MKIIVFDKDGVLVDSVKEIFHECVVAYGKVNESKENFSKFTSLYPFAKKAEDLYPIMALIESRNQAYDISKLDGYDMDAAKEFKEKFYASRKHMVETDFENWSMMIKPFKFAIEAANNLSKKYNTFMSTNADMFSTLKQVDMFGIEIPKENIISKEVSTDKIDHMKLIAKKKAVSLSDIIFIDNSIENLKSIMKIGCMVALASWVTNYKQIEEAEKMNITSLGKAKLIGQIEELMK